MDIPIVKNPNAPLPAKMQHAQAVAPTPARPPGWWDLRNLSGSLEGVTKAIEASDAPDHWKAAIKADIAARCTGEFNFVYLDVHFFVENGNACLHYTATPDKKLL